MPFVNHIEPSDSSDEMRLRFARQKAMRKVSVPERKVAPRASKSRRAPTPDSMPVPTPDAMEEELAEEMAEAFSVADEAPPEPAPFPEDVFLEEMATAGAAPPLAMPEPVATPPAAPDRGEQVPGNQLIVTITDQDQEQEGRTTAILSHAFTYMHPQSNAVIYVPRGYVTDFASIPGWLRTVLSPFGRHAKAAVAHDWLYTIGEKNHRAFADAVFRDAMIELGVDHLACDRMYTAVRLFARGAYDREHHKWGTYWGDWRTGKRLCCQTAHPDSPFWHRPDCYRSGGSRFVRPPDASYLKEINRWLIAPPTPHRPPGAPAAPERPDCDCMPEALPCPFASAEEREQNPDACNCPQHGH